MLQYTNSLKMAIIFSHIKKAPKHTYQMILTFVISVSLQLPFRERSSLTSMFLDQRFCCKLFSPSTFLFSETQKKVT